MRVSNSADASKRMYGANTVVFGREKRNGEGADAGHFEKKNPCSASTSDIPDQRIIKIWRPKNVM